MPLIKIVIGEKSKDKDSAKPHPSIEAPAQKKPSLKKRLLAASCAIILVSALAGVLWRYFIWQPANANPFTPALTASIKFPLYHPTYIPPGFHTVANSVTEPETGVVVFSLSGPKGQKIYFSEEARPTSYDVGGFFTKLSGLREYSISGGSIAIGKLNNEHSEVGSFLNGQVWIISNTTASIPLSQITSMLKSLTSEVST